MTITRTPWTWIVAALAMAYPCCAAAQAPAGRAAADKASAKTVEQLIDELKDAEPLARASAADALGAMGQRAKPAVSALLQGCRDKELWVVFAMTDALASLGEVAVPELIEALKTAHDPIRVRAAQALGGMGAAAKPAETALRKALDDPLPRVRNLAAAALKAIESRATRPTKPALAGGVIRPLAADTSPDWLGFRGLRRDGISIGTGLLQQWPADGLRLLWKLEGLGPGYSSVAIVGRRLYTMGDLSGEKTNAQHVLAFDLDPPKRLWAMPIGPGHKDGPRCTPSVDGGLLYVLGTDGDLVCLETAGGAIRWRKHLVKDFGGKLMSSWKFCESPLIDGDRLVCTPGGAEAGIVALDKKTGEVLWKAVLPALGDQGKDGAAYCSMVAAEIEGVRQYVQIVGRGAVAVAAADGRFLWGYNRIANDVANIPTPVVRGNQVFVTNGYQTGSALLRIVRDGQTFKAEEAYFLEPDDFENHHGGVVLLGDWLFGGGGQNRGLPTCLNFATGEIAWKAKAPARGSAAVLYADGHLLFRYDRGDLVWIEANPREFRIHGRFLPLTGDGPAWAYPVIHDKKLYLRHGDVLACYSIAQT